MKRIMALILASLILISMSACGAVESEKNVLNYDGNKEIDENEEPEIEAGFEGVWYIDDGYPNYTIFYGDETCKLIAFEDDGTVDEIETIKYMVNDDGTMTVNDGEETEKYNFELSGDTLKLNNVKNVNDNDSTVVFTKLMDANNQKVFAGRWIPITELSIYLCIDSERGKFEEVTAFEFYADGTYKLEVGPIFGESDERNGNYQIVHDGRAFTLDGNDYHDFELLGNDFMILTDQDGAKHLLICVDFK
ncbi:MAG: hypothetical protein E7456_04295 [Ruminococcaceae bacterium]|nr:hypothetical protein [Oscillospiraceae bacterium]